MGQSSIEENYSYLKDKIAKSAQDSGREFNAVRLLAVSKTHPACAIEKLYQLGHRDFGESYVQEAVDKIQSLTYCNDICWHFIGPIQSNKTKQIATYFSWVHSIDRLKIAVRLSEQRPSHLKPLNFCIQVNISGETTKSGVSPVELFELAKEVKGLPNLHLRGLMTIPRQEKDFERQRIPYCQLRLLRDELQQKLGWPLDTLSMGVSADLEAAIQEGATLVRIGTDLFGLRSSKKQFQ